MLCKIVTILTLVLAAGAAQAQPAPATGRTKALVGAWEISNAQRDKRCSVTFAVTPVPNGFKVDLEPACGTVFPPMKEVTSWKLGDDDVVRLLDARNDPVLEFTEVEGGLYEGERRGEGLYFMQTQAALKAEIRSADQLFGDWRILREMDKPLCVVTLSKTASGGSGSYRLVVKPGCEASIAGVGFATWRLDRDQLVLAGKTGTWRFAESDATTWERMPLSTTPMYLMKQ